MSYLSSNQICCFKNKLIIWKKGIERKNNKLIKQLKGCMRDQDFISSVINKNNETIFSINRALSKINNNSFGYCEYSGEPIGFERLEAVPNTRFSLSSKVLLEGDRV